MFNRLFLVIVALYLALFVFGCVKSNSVANVSNAIVVTSNVSEGGQSNILPDYYHRYVLQIDKTKNDNNYDKYAQIVSRNISAIQNTKNRELVYDAVINADSYKVNRMIIAYDWDNSFVFSRYLSSDSLVLSQALYTLIIMKKSTDAASTYFFAKALNSCLKANPKRVFEGILAKNGVPGGKEYVIQVLYDIEYPSESITLTDEEVVSVFEYLRSKEANKELRDFVNSELIIWVEKLPRMKKIFSNNINQ